MTIVQRDSFRISPQVRESIIRVIGTIVIFIPLTIGYFAALELILSL